MALSIFLLIGNYWSLVFQQSRYCELNFSQEYRVDSLLTLPIDLDNDLLHYLSEIKEISKWKDYQDIYVCGKTVLNKKKSLIILQRIRNNNVDNVYILLFDDNFSKYHYFLVCSKETSPDDIFSTWFKIINEQKFVVYKEYLSDDSFLIDSVEYSF